MIIGNNLMSGLLYEKNMKSSGENLMSAIIPLMKLLTLTAIGIVLSDRRTQIIPKATLKLLSNLVFALFLPCLVFTELGDSMTLANFARWWFIPVNVLVSTSVGLLLGLAVVLLCRPPPDFSRLVVISTAFGNTGNLPLAVVGSVCRSAAATPVSGPRCISSGVAYVSFAQWVSVILVYTLVYHMMEPPVDHHDLDLDCDRDRDRLRAHDVSGPLLVEAEWPGIEEKETEHSKTPFIATIFSSVSDVSQSTIPDDDDDLLQARRADSSRCLAEPRVVRRVRVVAEQTPVKHILQPPTIASLSAIVIGAVPRLKGLVFGDGAPLGFVTESLDIVASATVPSVMLILGGVLAEGPRRSALGLRTTVGICVARLLVLPLFGIAIVALADKLGILIDGGDGRMYRFVLLLQYTTPSAILLGAIASLRGYAVRETSALIFWQHLFALFSLSFYIVVYFKLLEFI